MPRPRRRVTLESGPKFDLREFRPRPDTVLDFGLHYSNGLDLLVRMELHVDLGELTLLHGGRRQWVRLEGLARGYGGVQWFMRCPLTNLRVHTLWKPPGAALFGSRHAWRGQVAYKSQFEDATARAWSTKARIARRLGGEPGEYDFPGRPKGMRQATFARLADRYWHAEDVLDDQLCRAVSAILRRYGPKALAGIDE